MDNQYFDIKKYPKSKKKFQCLGPCYHPKTKVVHPTALEIITDNENPFCPVDEWVMYDERTGESKKLITDICIKPTEKENISNKEMELNILTPYIDFNSSQFLKIYYKIFTFEDSVDWLYRNQHLPLGTRSRVVNCAFLAFGETVEIFDVRLVDFIVEFIKKKKIQEIYNKLFPYIGISGDEVTLVQNNLPKSELCVERTNFLIKTFITKEEINKFLTKYFIHKKNKWRDIKHHLNYIPVAMNEYFLNKIISTLQK